MSRSLVRLLVICGLFFAGAAAANADNLQNVAQGFSVDKTYAIGDLDAINTFNGNLGITIPIGMRHSVSSALSYQLLLTYAGNTWDHNAREREFDPDFPEAPQFLPYAFVARNKTNAGLGWRLSLGLIDVGEAGTPYISADGASHVFYPTLHDEPAVAGVLYTRDGSYLRQQRVGSEYVIEFPDGTKHTFRSDGRIRLMEDRFGNRVTITYTAGIDGAEDWKIDDGHRVHTVDLIRLSRTGTAPDTGVFDVVKTVSLSAPAGVSRTYTLSYAGNDTLTRISRPLVTAQDCTAGPNVYAPILAEVILPDSSKYVVTTDQGADGSYADRTSSGTRSCVDSVNSISYVHSFSGHVLGVKRPTGGITSWTYQAYTFPVDQQLTRDCEDVASCALAAKARSGVGVLERLEKYRDATTIASKRVYAQELLLFGATHSGASTKTTVTTVSTFEVPAAGGEPRVVSKSVHYYTAPHLASEPSAEYGLPYTRDVSTVLVPAGEANPDAGGRFLSSKVLDANDDLLRYTYVLYESDPGSSDSSHNRRVKSERVVQRDPVTASKTNELVTTNDDFDGFGHYRKVTTSTPAGVTPAIDRTVTTLYNRPDPQTDARSTARDSGQHPGTTADPFRQLAANEPWVLNTYSSQTVKEGASHNRTLFLFDTGTGFLQRKRVMRQTLLTGGVVPRDARDLVSVYEHLNGNVTAESHYGGDGAGAALDAEATLQAMPLPASPVAKILHTWQFGTLKSSKYADATFFSTRRTIDAHTGLATQSFDSADLMTEMRYDWGGRMTYSKPPGSASTEITYNVPTSTAQASVTIQQKDGTPVLIEAGVVYDDFGRVTSESRKMPSGSTSRRTTTYTGRGAVSTVSEWGSTSVTTYLYDALGRVVNATGPDGAVVKTDYRGGNTTKRTAKVALESGESDVTTTETYDDLGRLVAVASPGGTTTAYGYDVGGRLSSVNMSWSGTTQTRSFTYDGRGFLMSETHPEWASRPTTYTYDGRGQILTKTTPNVTGYTATTRSGSPADGISYHSNGMVDEVRHMDVGGGEGPVDKQTRAANGLPRPLQITYSGFCTDMPATPDLASKAVNQNEAANLTVNVSGATTWQWYSVSGGTSTPLSGQTGQTLTAGFATTTQVWVRVGNGTCTADSKIATVTVNACAAPEATITVTPSTVAPNTTATASVPDAGPNAVYAWTLGGTGASAVSGTGSRQFQFQVNCSGGPVTLSVSVSTCKTSSKGPQPVTTGETTGVTLSHDGPSTVPHGGSTQLEAALTGTAPWTIKWSDLSGSSVTSSSTATRSLTNLTATRTYTLTVTDSCGTVTSAPVTVTVVPTPAALVATAASASSVALSWSFASSADEFQLERRAAGSILTIAVPGSAVAFTDTNRAADTSYLYRIRARKSGVWSNWSNFDVATTVVFGADVTPGMTISAQDVVTLRTAVNSVRTLAGLTAFAFTDPTLPGSPMRAVHVQELRSSLDAARQSLALPALSYTDSALAAGTVFRAAHINDLRGGVR